MREPSLLRLDEQHPELCRLFAAARAQEPTPDAVERLVRTVRQSVVMDTLMRRDLFELTRRLSKRIWTTRTTIVAGALGLAAAAFAAVEVTRWLQHGRVTNMSVAAYASAHVREPSVASADSAAAPWPAADMTSVAPAAQHVRPTPESVKRKTQQQPPVEPVTEYVQKPAVVEPDISHCRPGLA